MSCHIEDHGKEMRECAQEINDLLMRAQDWHQFYNEISGIAVSIRLATAFTNCEAHSQIFKTILETVYAVYFKTRLQWPPDAVFVSFRADFADRFHASIMNSARLLTTLTTIKKEMHHEARKDAHPAG
jgi:hypothetical protein